MSLDSQDLPRAICSPRAAKGAAGAMASAQAALSAAQSALDSLATQSAMFGLADIFADFPGLASIACRRDGRHPGTSVFPVFSPEPNSGPERNRLFGSVAQAICRWLDELPDGAVARISGREFARPAPGRALAEGLIEQALGPEGFALWQREALAQAAKPPKPAKAQRSGGSL